MPIYEFLCPRCRVKTELLMTAKQRDAGKSPPCSHCGKKTKPLLSKFARTSLGWQGNSSGKEEST